ncbi:MAG TPA: sensor histidine kinase [Roseiarcus sp.]|jgi:two-component sensor histidine kinase|nr:sensor histidine kinase [Roseiarcus sp.]
MLTLAGTDTSLMDRPHTYREEAEHRIANSLQMISALVRQRAKSSQVSDPQTFLLEIADRIETVGKLHRLLGESTATGTVQIRKYLKEVCDRLRGALAPTATSFSFDCPRDCPLPAKTALPLALITAELVSNSLKYAHPTGLPTKITLSCRPDEKGDLTIVYEDDGVGFPEGFDVSEAGHVGMRLIQLLTKGVGGRHEWLSDPLGMRFEIVLPMSA